jgi:hypothetical protein
MIKKILTSALIIFVAVISKVIFSEIANAHSKNQVERTNGSVPPTQYMNEILVKASSLVNQNLPVMIDSETRLDSTLGFNYKFTYVYTLVNYDADDLDKDAFISEYKKLVTNGACTTESLIPFFKSGVTVVYSYYGKDRKFIADIQITQSDCNAI